MSKNLSDNLSGLNDAAKQYIQARVDLIKLSVLSKATHLTTYLINSLVIILFGALIVMFALAAFVAWYGEVYHDYLTGLLLAVIILVVCAVLFFLFKKKIVTSAVLRSYSTMLFEENRKEEDKS